MDRGMISEDNIDFLRERKARYLVGTPKSQLKSFEAQLLEKEDWAEVQAGVEVKLVAASRRRAPTNSMCCAVPARGGRRKRP